MSDEVFSLGGPTQTRTDAARDGGQPSTVPGAAPHLAAAPGPTPDGPDVGYELLAILGQGGMGVVYKARQRSTGRVVALKVIRADRVADIPEAHRAVWAQRFRTEAQAAARIEHDHAVAVYEVGERGGVLFYSMRYVDGRSLADLLRDGPLANRRAAALMEPVARAVQCAHERGILHRDLKPRNVLVGADDRPYVTDFGLAKLLEEAGEVTCTGEFLGTPSYAAPEQTRDAARATALSDVYSLGATLYATLTGRPPFQAATAAETMRQVQDDEPLAPRMLNPAVDPDLETACLKCLEKDPQRRYASAAALADDLRRYLQGRPTVARPVGRLGRARRWCRRNRAVAALMGLVLFVFAAGAATATAFAVLSDLNAKQSRENEKRANDNAKQARENETVAKAALDRNRRLLHVSRINQALQAANDSRARRLKELLAEMRPAAGETDLRGWEWHYLARLAGHGRPLLPAQDRRLTFGNGDFPAAVSADGGRMVLAPFGLPEPATAPIDPRLLSGLPGLPNAKELADLLPKRPADAAPEVIAIEVREVATGKVVFRTTRPDSVSYHRFALSADGRHLAGLSEVRDPKVPPEQRWRDPAPLTVEVWEVDSGRDLGRFTVPHTGRVTSLAVERAAGRVVVGLSPYAESLSPVPPPLPAEPPPARLKVPEVVVWERATGRASHRPLGGAPDAGRVVTVVTNGTTALRIDAEQNLGPLTIGPPRGGAEHNSTRMMIETWDLRAEGPKFVRRVRREGSSFEPSPSLTALAVVGPDGAVSVYHVATGESEGQFVPPAEVTRGYLFGPDALAVSDDGRRVVLGTRSGTLLVCDRAADASGDEWRTAALLGHTAAIGRTAVSADGRRAFSGLLAVGADPDDLPLVWDLEPDPGYVRRWPPGACYDDRGRWAVTNDQLLQRILEEGPLKVWDTASGKEVVRIEWKGQRLSARAVSADGRRVLGSGLPPLKPGGPLPFSFPSQRWALWDTANPARPLATGESPLTAYHLMTPEGRWLLINRHDGPLEVSPFPSLAASPPPGLRWEVRSVEDGAVAGTIRFADDEVPFGFNFVWQVAVRPGGDRVAAATFRVPPPPPGMPKIDLTGTGLFSPTLRVYALPDGQQVWERELPKEFARRIGWGMPGHWPATLAYSPDGSRLAVAWPHGEDKTLGRVLLLDSGTGEVVRSLRGITREHTDIDRPGVVAFGPGGRLAVGFGRDTLVWGPDGEEPLYRLIGHDNEVFSAVFGPDGSRLFTLEAGAGGATGTRAASLRVWDLICGQELLALPAGALPAGADSFRERMWLEGDRLYVMCMDGVRVYDGTPLDGAAP